MSEQRNTVRRTVNSFGMRGGEFQPSKAWTTVGNCLIVWLIVKHADALINHSDTLLVLLALLVLPEIAKKMLTMRYTGGNTTERTESVERTTSTEKREAG